MTPDFRQVYRAPDLLSLRVFSQDAAAARRNLRLMCRFLAFFPSIRTRRNKAEEAYLCREELSFRRMVSQAWHSRRQRFKASTGAEWPGWGVDVADVGRLLRVVGAESGAELAYVRLA